MNMKKKLVTVCLVACMAVTAVAGGTLAYFTDAKQATNTFTVGNVELELTETAWDNGAEHKLMPSANWEKNPVIKLKGSERAYVMAEVTLSKDMYDVMHTYAAQTEDPSDNEDVTAMMKTWFTGYNPAEWKPEVEDKGGAKVVKLYFGEMTPEDSRTLFTAVKVPDELKTAATGKPTVTIVAKAIQSEGLEEAKAYEELEKVTDAEDIFAK